MANPTTDRLLRLLAYFENGAASIRATLAFLKHDPTARGNGKANGNGHDADMPTVLAAAVGMERRRRATKGKRGYGVAASVRDRRQRTADLLAKLDTTTPTPNADLDPILRAQLGPMVVRGYMKKKGGGYVRTSKTFHVTPPPVDH